MACQTTPVKWAASESLTQSSLLLQNLLSSLVVWAALSLSVPSFPFQSSASVSLTSFSTLILKTQHNLKMSEGSEHMFLQGGCP